MLPQSMPELHTLAAQVKPAWHTQGSQLLIACTAPNASTDDVHCGSCCRYDVSKKHPQGKPLASALSQVFDPELTNWLLAELAENRDKRVGPNKVGSSCMSRPQACFHKSWHLQDTTLCCRALQWLATLLVVREDHWSSFLQKQMCAWVLWHMLAVLSSASAHLVEQLTLHWLRHSRVIASGRQC